MKHFSWLLLLSLLFVISCGSAESGEARDSVLEQKISIIEKEHKNKPLEVLAKICQLRKEYGDKINPFVGDYMSTMEALPKHKLPAMMDSPNQEFKVSSSIALLHFRNNYPSGNLFIRIKQGKKMVLKYAFPFNTEKKIELAPGTYDIAFFIDRKFNDSLYAFADTISLRGGKAYIGEFNITSQYNKSGACPEGTVVDDDVCMKLAFNVVDNCADGYHLVEHLCCEEGFNFVMEGRCSQYSDKVEHVVCPKGYEPGGKGRCCPKGEKFIDGACRKPDPNAPAAAPTE